MTPADGTYSPGIAVGEAISQLPVRRVPTLADLERELGGWIAEHLAETRERLDVPMVEFNADMQALEEFSTAVVQAAKALAKLTQNNISCDGPTQSASALADLIQEEPAHLLLPSAARMVEAMVACKLKEPA